jgi:hypothetical protein
MIDSASTDHECVRPQRAWYAASIETFLGNSAEQILGVLAANSDFNVEILQRNAWQSQIVYLKDQLPGLDGHILFEYNIPRMGRRIDTVLIVGSVVFALEFKVGSEKVHGADLNQVWDYALDLKNFHKASHPLAIVPVLVATQAPNSGIPALIFDGDKVCRPVAVHEVHFRSLIERGVSQVLGSKIEAADWLTSSYQPTPTIIEAAKSLYANHSVEAIARYDAGAANLRITSRRVEEIVKATRISGQKSICFVTGVPGAGKTLVGLNLATSHGKTIDKHHAVFLSGNGPLVTVLREALTRDEVTRKKKAGEKPRKGKVAESVKAFIQNIHHFRDDALHDEKAPTEHVVIFDEAQRAWDLKQTASFMKRKKGRDGFAHSEPDFLISCMDRHQEWAVIVCLVGGGQEINTGEAGIAAWLQALLEHYPEWNLHISSKLSGSEYAAGEVLAKLGGRAGTHFEDDLHLSVSMRSFRAESVSEFVRAVLDCEIGRASEVLKQLKNYPLVITRDLDLAKQWIRKHARGTERFGLVASSKAMRLKPHAIDIRVNIDPVPWFLNDSTDTRASNYLEDAATEFQVQGLELDWVCVNWDGDLRYNDTGWSFHDFRGSRWQNVNNTENQSYLRNAYRVLLTRARQGMVIFVPPGNPEDPTRSPLYYDRTFEYLKSIGVPALEA